MYGDWLATCGIRVNPGELVDLKKALHRYFDYEDTDKKLKIYGAYCPECTKSFCLEGDGKCLWHNGTYPVTVRAFVLKSNDEAMKKVLDKLDAEDIKTILMIEGKGWIGDYWAQDEYNQEVWVW